MEKDLTNSEAISAIQSEMEKYIEDLDQLNIVKINLSAGALSKDIKTVEISYSKDTKIAKKWLHIGQSGRLIDGKAAVILRDSMSQRTSKKISNFNFKEIKTNLGKAIILVQEEMPNYEYAGVSSYDMFSGVANNPQTDRFNIQFTDKNKSNHVEGRNIVTDYYEYTCFATNGKITFDD
jgi:hypothetical protein